MMDKVEIRDYTNDDEADLIRLLRELQTHESQYYDRMVKPAELAGWYIEDIQKDCRDHAGHIRVAWVNGEAAGYCVLLTRVRNEEPDELPFSYAYVSEIVVADTMRGKGVGKVLLSDAEAIARASGAKWLRVHVLAKNTMAHDVYASYGFEDHLIEMEMSLQ
jgi:ribosomal protein S18 acetylase RimI-like enzyme